MGALPLTTAQRAIRTAVMQRLAQLHDAVPRGYRVLPRQASVADVAVGGAWDELKKTAGDRKEWRKSRRDLERRDNMGG